MSLQTWKDEFYKTDIYDVPYDLAVEHSLQKWIGLREENLIKHDIYKSHRKEIRDFEGNTFQIDASSCALCFHNPFSCEGCPIYKSTGDACDAKFGAYTIWINYSMPEPMIKVLENVHFRKSYLKEA